MNKILLSVILSLATVFVFASKPHTDHIKVNPERSSIKWIGSKISESHEGTVGIRQGVLDIKHGVLVGGEISIDMKSITNTDIEDEKYKLMIEDHLKSDDFFDVKEFPLAVIIIKEVIKGEENSYDIVADLTIKEVTHSINFKANVDIKGLMYKATAKIKIDRTKWNVKYNSGNFFKDLGDKLILDEIEFDISLFSGLNN